MDGRSLTLAFLLLLSLKQFFPAHVSARLSEETTVDSNFVSTTEEVATTRQSQIGETTVDSNFATTTEGVATTRDSQNVIISLRSSASVLESTAFVRIFIDVIANFDSVSDSETILCEFSFTDGSATENSDYGPVENLRSQTFTIAADTSEVSFDIQISNDQIVETDETFLVTLTALSGNDVTVTATTGMTSTTVTIEDDDAAVLSITDGSGNGGLISQNSNHIVLRVSSSNAYQDDVTLGLQFSGFTDIFSGNPPNSIVLPAGSTIQTINIPLVSGRGEGHQVTVTATAPSNNPPVTISQPSMTFTTSNIVSQVRIGFSSSSYAVTEGETTRIQLSASDPVPVTFLAGLVASGNVNDIVIRRAVTFTTGQSTAFISVTAISDSTPESRERVTLSIDPLTLPDGIIVDPNRATATLDITDTTPIIDTTPRPPTPPIVVLPIPTVPPTVAITPTSAYIIAGVVVGVLLLVFIILSVACCYLYFSSVRPIGSTGSYDVTPYEGHPNFRIARKRYVDDFYY